MGGLARVESMLWITGTLMSSNDVIFVAAYKRLECTNMQLCNTVLMFPSLVL